MTALVYSVMVFCPVLVCPHLGVSLLGAGALFAHRAVDRRQDARMRTRTLSAYTNSVCRSRQSDGWMCVFESFVYTCLNHLKYLSLLPRRRSQRSDVCFLLRHVVWDRSNTTLPSPPPYVCYLFRSCWSCLTRGSCCGTPRATVPWPFESSPT